MIFQNNSLFSNTITFFNEKVQPSLTDRQKKVLIITALAVSVLLAILSLLNWNRNGWSLKNPPVNGQGQGRKTFSDGNVWEGEFKDGMLNGLGKKISDREVLFGKGGFFEILGKGTIREGEFKNSLLNGQGKIIRVDGTVEEGECVNDFLVKGKQTHPNGIIDEGEFDIGAYQGWLHGQGKRVYPSGEIEEGEFVHGRLCGKGKIIFPDGTIYEGDHLKGMSSSVQISKKLGILGQGKITLPSGVILEGEIRNGKLHGEGKEMSSSVSSENFS